MSKLKNGKYVAYRDINEKPWFNNFEKEINTELFLDKYGTTRPIADWLEEKKIGYIEEVVNRGIAWEDTEQGYMYWHDIYKAIRDGNEEEDTLAKIIGDM